MNRRTLLKFAFMILIGGLFTFGLAAGEEREKTKAPPSIRISGIDSKKVTGHVANVRYSKHKVVLYISLNGGQWWVKPWGNDPKSDIPSSGKWKVPYVSVNSDKKAKYFIAFLVPEKLKKVDIPTTLYGWAPTLDGSIAVSEVAER